jgi:hypothetical protein
VPLQRTMVAVASAALFVAATSFAAGEWIAVKNPAELRSLFSNKTFRYEKAFHGWIAQFREDGTGVWREVVARGSSLVAGDPLLRKWAIKGRDQVCITSIDTGAVHCYRFERNRKRRNELTMMDVSSQFIVTIIVEDGI